MNKPYNAVLVLALIIFGTVLHPKIWDNIILFGLMLITWIFSLMMDMALANWNLEKTKTP